MNRVAKEAGSSGAEVGVPSQSIAERYRDLLVEYRHSQLQLTARNLARLEGVFDAAVGSLTAGVERSAPGSLAGAQFGALLADVEATVSALRGDYGHLLDAGMSELAQHAADREAATAALVGAREDPALAADITKTFAASEARVTVAFGRLAQSAVERMAQMVYSDGWKLSDRLYRLDSNLRETIRQTLVQGVAEQISARQMAGRLRESLAAAGADNPRHQAMRIARTEIVTAHREAHVQSTLDPETGKLKPYISAIGWRLSLSHPHSDICDVWAADDGDGLGPGNYLPDNVPQDHPHGLCYTTTVLVDHPEVSAPSTTPNTADVPESQARYYLEKNDDGPAKRWLAARG